MPTYRVLWSEGDPLIIVAATFGDVAPKVVAHVRKDDDPPEEADIIRWIDGIEKISDEDPIS